MTIVAPFWRGASRKQSLEDKRVEKDALVQHLETMKEKLDPEPNWSAIWSLPEPLQITDYSEGWEKHFEYYPGVAYLCYVHVRG